jgi:2-polyprenyl-3-methyl-5-hydroxy-6-metoxy-1,4-benzoquinol methylase
VSHDATSAQEFVWDSESVRRFWDFQSNYPENYFSERYGSQIVSAIVPRLKPGLTLDFGCGTGAILEQLLRRDVACAGLDSSRQSVASCVSRLRMEPQFEGAFVSSDELPNGKSFENVLLIEVLEHLGDSELNEVGTSVSRILPPGGKLFVTTPNNEDLSREIVFCPTCDHTFHRWQHVRSWSRKSLVEFFAGFGLQEDFSLATNFGASNHPVRRVLETAKALLRRNDAPHLLIGFSKGPY